MSKFLRTAVLSTIALGAALSGGCEWPWSEKIEVTPESRARYMTAVTDLVKVRSESKLIADTARTAVNKRDEDLFTKSLDELRHNLNRQIDLMVDAELSASTKELRKSIRAERERTEFDRDQIGEYEKVWRSEIEISQWRQISWR